MVCKTNNKEIWPYESGSAPEIQVSWLSYGDIKIRDTFVYEYTPLLRLKFVILVIMIFLVLAEIPHSQTKSVILLTRVPYYA